MIIPNYAFILVSPNNPLGIAFPNRLNLKNNTLPIVAGHNNQYKGYLLKKDVINIKETYPIRFKKIDNYYKAGPLVGILTTRDAKGFKGNKNNYIDLILMGIKTGVLVYVFTAESLDKQNRTVEGYLYLPTNGTWQKKKMPLPDVVYNRIPSRKEEKRIIINETVNYLEKEHIPYFNHYFFDKVTLYKWMSKTKEFDRFIPDTRSLTIENLRKMLDTYHMIYLKPVHGKAGIGFIKIEKKDNIYFLTYQGSKITQRKTLDSFNLLWKDIISLINKKNYIIQRGINLKEYHSYPFDIRILVQKNGEGIWKVSGIGIRVAGARSITTHVPRGGYIEMPFKVFNYSFGKKANDWEDAISKLTIEMAKHIEKRSEKNLGELSLDLGIDKENNLWFFEANSKPMKFDEPNIRYTSLLRLMQYFRFLTGFTD
ncbi:MAG: YheC/YheD family protein [Vulcanibacillus sp.]